MDEIEGREPEFDFDDAAELCGLSGLQSSFARAILNGANKTQAARVAGYSGSDEQLRSAGYKAFNSPKVQAFLNLAAKGGYGVADEPGDAAELKRILWKHARGDDKNHSIRATEVLNRIEKDDASAAEDEETMLDVLEQIAKRDLVMALRLAESQGIGFKPEGWDKIHRCPECRQLMPEHYNTASRPQPTGTA